MFPTISDETIYTGTQADNIDYLNNVYLYLSKNQNISSKENIEQFLKTTIKILKNDKNIKIFEVFTDVIFKYVSSLKIDFGILAECLDLIDTNNANTIKFSSKFETLQIPELFLDWAIHNKINLKDKDVIIGCIRSFYKTQSMKQYAIINTLLNDFDLSMSYDVSLYKSILSIYDEKKYTFYLNCPAFKLIFRCFDNKIIPENKHYNMMLSTLSENNFNIALRLLISYGYKLTYNDIIKAMEVKRKIHDIEAIVASDEDSNEYKTFIQQYAELSTRINFYPYNFQAKYTIENLRTICTIWSTENDKLICKFIESGIKPDELCLEYYVYRRGSKNIIKLMVENGATISDHAKQKIIKYHNQSFYDKLVKN